MIGDFSLYNLLDDEFAALGKSVSGYFYDIDTRGGGSRESGIIFVQCTAGNLITCQIVDTQFDLFWGFQCVCDFNPLFHRQSQDWVSR